VFSAALIKKRRYWPKYIEGEQIKAHFDDKEIGTVDAIRGELDEVPLHVFCMKEEDYVMMLMSIFGTCLRVGDERFRKIGNENQRISFKYPELVYNHFQYRDAVDSHNARQMAPIALEEVWATKRWPHRIFTYLLGTTEVNCNLGESAFGEAQETRPQLEFRRLLGKDLNTTPMWIMKKMIHQAHEKARDSASHWGMS
jgi:Transposase IS4